MIEIEDEGEGIPEGEQDKVFETFTWQIRLGAEEMTE